MMVLMILVISQLVTCQSSQKSESLERQSDANGNLIKVHDLPTEKPRSGRSNSKSANDSLKANKENETQKSSKRKSKGLGFYPYFLEQSMPYGYYRPQSKDGENGYPAEWLSRTEPFKKNPQLVDSPTYYIRLPPNPYAFVPGLGYVSRPTALSDPEILDGDKQETGLETGNDLFQDLFYRVPIKFVSNGKPTAVYQLAANEQSQTENSQTGNFVDLNKGPYVFNGKPGEIFLLAQIYNALYGDELDHFYP